MSDRDKLGPAVLNLRDGDDVTIVLQALAAYQWAVAGGEVGIGPDATKAREQGARRRERALVLAEDLRTRATIRDGERPRAVPAQPTYEVEATEHVDAIGITGEMAQRLADGWGFAGMAVMSHEPFRAVAWWGRRSEG